MKQNNNKTCEQIFKLNNIQFINNKINFRYFISLEFILYLFENK